MHAPRTPAGSAQAEFWSGRLSLQVHSEPVQSFSAGFDLKELAEQGIDGTDALTIALEEFGDATAPGAEDVCEFESVDSFGSSVFGNASHNLTIPNATTLGWTVALSIHGLNPGVTDPRDFGVFGLQLEY